MVQALRPFEVGTAPLDHAACDHHSAPRAGVPLGHELVTGETRWSLHRDRMAIPRGSSSSRSRTSRSSRRCRRTSPTTTRRVKDGWGDTQLLVKYRLFSANEETWRLYPDRLSQFHLSVGIVRQRPAQGDHHTHARVRKGLGRLRHGRHHQRRGACGQHVEHRPNVRVESHLPVAHAREVLARGRDQPELVLGRQERRQGADVRDARIRLRPRTRSPIASDSPSAPACRSPSRNSTRSDHTIIFSMRAPF